MNPRILLLALPLLAGPAPAQEPADDLTPPLSGRPEEFTGGVGVFRMEATAEPLAVRVGESIRLTLRVRAEGKCHAPPDRPRLTDADDGPSTPLFRKLFKQDFAVEELSPERREVGPGRWEFSWSLKPRSTAVKEIPSIGLAYYSPGRKYEKTFSDDLPIQVSPAAETRPPKVEKTQAPPVPDFLLQVESGDRLLDRERDWVGPSLPVILLLLASPPVAAVGWLVVWRRLHPEASRRRQRSRAARVALKELDTAPDSGAVADAVAGYLRERLGLPPRSPTPAEAETSLGERGAPASLTGQAGDFFRRADAARYAPGAADEALARDARALILAVEAQAWPGYY